MAPKYNLQPLDIPSDWTIMRNVFYAIDPFDLVSDSDKYDYIYHQEDLLYLVKSDYHLDLGWYGYDDLTNNATGYYIHLTDSSITETK